MSTTPSTTLVPTCLAVHSTGGGPTAVSWHSTFVELLNRCLDDAQRRSTAETLRSFVVGRSDLGDELHRSTRGPCGVGFAAGCAVAPSCGRLGRMVG